MGQAFRYARERLGKSADRQKKVYDRLAKDRNFQVGDWVWYFYTPKKQKFRRPFLGTYLVIRKLGQVTYVIQAERARKPKVVHVDHLKRFEAEEMPKSWLEEAAQEEWLSKVGGTPGEPEEVPREGSLPPVGEDSPTDQDVGGEPLESGEGWDAESLPDVGEKPLFELWEDFWWEVELPWERSLRKRGVHPPRRFEDYA